MRSKLKCPEGLPGERRWREGPREAWVERRSILRRGHQGWLLTTGWAQESDCDAVTVTTPSRDRSAFSGSTISSCPERLSSFSS